MTRALIQFNQLHISFPAVHGAKNTIVEDFSLTIAAGEILALVGASGSGKTLTALSMLQLLPASAQVSGHIWLEQQDLLHVHPAAIRKIRGREIGMIFQEPLTALNPLHRVGKQIMEAVRLHQAALDKQTILQKVKDVFAEVELTPAETFMSAYPHQLSGGQRQRVMIAMALVNRPRLLIADEPTTALDASLQREILALLRRLRQRYAMSILYISHDLRLVRQFADRMAIMHQGKLIELADTQQIFRAPQQEYTQKLMQAVQFTATPMPESSGKTILDVQNLGFKVPVYQGIFRRVKGYKPLLQSLNFKIKRGETLGLIGQSGSGKTTLARCLVRLYQPEGKIIFLGKDIVAPAIEKFKAVRSEIQMVFQDPFASLNPRMNLLQVISEGLLVHQRLTRKERDQQVSWAMEQVDLQQDLKWRYPHELSGGQRQRVALARAIILKPQLIVLDEPTSALDKMVQKQILVLLKALQARLHLSYLLISHDLQVIAELSHHVLVLYQGRIVEQGKFTDLFDRPQHRYTKALMDIYRG